MADINPCKQTCIVLLLLAVGGLLQTSVADECVQDQNCELPDCFCPTLQHPLGKQNVPQIVYFGFDDAVQPQVSSYYNELFTESRKNPNGCPITMSLYVSHEYTLYDLVAEYYKRGMEIGVHSVTHTDIDTAEKLMKEAKEQKENIEKLAGVPADKVLGWRSPNLKTAGDDQPRVLAELKYLYDISLTYSKDTNYIWPFTLDYGYPYPCTITPCPSPTASHPGFWEVMVHSLMDPATGLPCGYVDGCRPQGEDAALEYLWSNFLNTYEVNRAPFGLNMHAAWFATPEYLTAMGKFIDKLLQTPDVYIVNVEQMMAWMRAPVPLSEIKTFAPWGCEGHGHEMPQLVSKAITNRTSSTPAQQKAPPKPPNAIRLDTPQKQASPATTLFKQREHKHSAQSNVINSSQANPNSFLTWYRQIHHSDHWHQIRPKPTEATTTRAPSTSTIPNVHRSRFWENFLKYSREQQLEQGNPYTCVQEVNCERPGCYCRTTNPPLNLEPQAIPQIVYLAIDSPVDGRTFAPLMQIFSPFRKNPNGCPISGTIFVPSSGNYPSYIEVLKSKGIRTGVRSGTYSGHFSGDVLRRRVQSEIYKSHYKPSSRYGWRGFASLAPTDDVFQALRDSGVSFDSSIITGSLNMAWPYTLDFGLQDKCSVLPSRCPSKGHPGLWEVPMNPLIVPGQSNTCIFPDTCPGAGNSEEQVYELLTTNFRRHYNNNRAPLGINMHGEWLSGGNGGAGLRGLVRFIDEVLKGDDVVIVSIEQMLEWITSPSTDIRRFPC